MEPPRGRCGSGAAAAALGVGVARGNVTGETWAGT